MHQIWADFDGDGIAETAAVYRLQDEWVVALYKHNGLTWYTADCWRGCGTGITAFYAAPAYTRGPARYNLVIGWQNESEPSYLSLYEWGYGRFREAARYAHPQEAGTGFPSRSVRAPDLYPATLKSADGTQWGYINSAGQWVLKPQYEYAFPYQDNGMAIVQHRDHNGVIDKSGRYVVEPKYLSINSYSEGLAVAMNEKGFLVLNEAGAEVTPRTYDYISSYQDGRALFSTTNPQGNNVYGYLDPSGKEVIPAQYPEAGDFHGGKAVVRVKDGEYALIDRNGKKLSTYPYPFVGALGEGLLSFQKEVPGKYGYLNEQGKVAIPLQYTGALPFEEGRAVVNTAEDYGNKYGLIDKTGAFVIQPGYNEVNPLGEGRVALGRAIKPEEPYMGSKYAIADLSGKILTDFMYYDVADYKQGYASVNDGKMTFFLDRGGRKAAGLPVVQGTGTLSFEGTLIRADVDQRVSYLDRSGRVVWEQNKVIPLAPPYRVVEHKYNPNKDYLVYYPQVEGMANATSQKQVNDKLKELSQIKPIPPGTQMDHSYTGDFSVTFFRKQLLVLELNAYDYPFGAAHGMPSRVFAHIDLVSGRFYELPDLFKPGSNYVKVLSDIIAAQIKNNPQYSYVWPESYKGIEANQPFFVTAEALHLYFAPYEIAPYAAGFPTFNIPFQEIMGIINTGGAFWQSFHG